MGDLTPSGHRTGFVHLQPCTATLSATPGVTSVTLNWTALYPCAADCGWNVYVATQSDDYDFSSPSATTGPGVLTAAVSGLNSNTAYYFVVRSIGCSAPSNGGGGGGPFGGGGGGGSGAPSPEVVVTTQTPPPAITWDPANTVAFALSNGNLTATAPNSNATESTQATSANIPALAYAEVKVTGPSPIVRSDTTLLVGILGYQLQELGDNAGLTANGYTLPDLVSGNVINIAYNQTTHSLWLGVNGTYFNSGNPASSTNPTFTGVTAGAKLLAMNVNTDGTPQTCGGTMATALGQFSDSIPAGFSSWSGL